MNIFRTVRFLQRVALIAWALLALPPAPAQIQIVMLNDEEGGISVSDSPQIANGGKVAFKGSREIGGDEVDGVYIGYGGGGVSPLVEVGSPEEIEEIGSVGMSSSGTVAYWALLRLTYPDFTGQPKAQLYIRILRGADPYEYEFDRGFHNGGPIGINNRDELFVASPQGHLEFSWDARSSGASGWGGIFLGGGTPVSVNGTYLPPAAINNLGQVAFSLRPPGEALSAVKRGELRSIAPGSWQADIRTLASGFESIESLGLDDSGRAVFLGRLPGGTTALYESSGTPVVLASEGDGKGFSNFSAVAVSASGQIAFLATYESPSGNRRYGIFRGFNGATDKIVAEGDRLTFGGAEYEISVGGFGPRAYNDGGQIVFSGSISPPEDDGHGDSAGPASVRPSSHSGSHSGVFVTSGVDDPPPDDEPPGDDPADDPPNTFTWANGAGGAFATAANWEPAQVPVKNAERADTARFNLGAAYTVATPEAATERLLVRGGDVTLNVGTYTVAATSPDAPSVSITRSGILRVTGGALQSVNTVIGHGATTTTQVAEAHLFNAGTTWTNPGRMTIGGVSDGRLFVANGPTLTTGEARIGTDARGETIVGGANSLWEAGSVAVGYSDEGSLIVESGGHTRAERLHIGMAGGEGGVTIDGAGSLLTVTDSALNFYVGEGDGVGTLTVRNGGRVEAVGDTASLAVGSGEASSGSVLVTGFDAATNARSTLHVDPSALGYLVVGWLGGTGSAQVTEGALLESNLADVGALGGTGDVLISGSGNALASRWENSEKLTVGQDGSGELHVEAGAFVSTKHLAIGDDPEGDGLVVVHGVGSEGLPSRLRVTESVASFFVGSYGGHGELRVEAGGRVDVEPLGVLQIGLSEGDGSVVVRGFDSNTGHRSTLHVERSVELAGLVAITQGTLEIVDGGLLETRHGWVGFEGTGAHAEVSGVGQGLPSRWDNLGILDIGRDRAGSLHITAGGEVSTAQLYGGIGAMGDGEILVHGVGDGGLPSTLLVTDSRLQFDLGLDCGRAALHVEEGGRVVAPGESWLSLYRGEIVVRGFDSATSTRSRLEVDGEGYGWLVISGGGASLRVEDGARVHSQLGILGLGGSITATAYVGGAGLGQPAYWRVGHDLQVGHAIGDGSPGALTIAVDGAVSVGEIDAVAGSLVIGNSGSLSGHGTIIAPGGVGVAGGVNNFAGTVSPGNSPGVLTIEGDYTQGAAGVLAIEIGGLEAGYDYDQLAVTGAVSFAPGAKIRVTFIDSNPDDAVAETFIPRTGDVFSFLVADTVTLPTGAALGDLIEFTNLPAGVVLTFDLEVVNGTTRVKATTTAAPPATGWRITAHPRSVLATAGSATTFSIALEGVAGATYQWRRDGIDIAGATGASYTLPSPQLFHAGEEYSVVITVDGISVESRVAPLGVAAPAPSDARMLNLSTRALGSSGDEVLIPGFVIAGSGTKRVLLRAVGPELTRFGVNGVLPDPRMRVVHAGATIASNDDWGTNANAAAIVATAGTLGAFGLAAGGKDAALLLDLAPGAYTVPTEDVAGAAGVALVELYDADAAGVAATARLVNLSNRGYAGQGDEVMIPGFVISADGPKTLLVRVVGPGLSRFVVDGVMADPILQLHRRDPDTGVDELWFTQDNWGESPAAATTAQVAQSVGAFALAAGSQDAAFVVTLAPGVYTAVGRSADGASGGVVLVEIYVVE